MPLLGTNSLGSQFLPEAAKQQAARFDADLVSPSHALFQACALWLPLWRQRSVCTPPSSRPLSRWAAAGHGMAWHGRAGSSPCTCPALQPMCCGQPPVKPCLFVADFWRRDHCGLRYNVHVVAMEAEQACGRWRTRLPGTGKSQQQQPWAGRQVRPSWRRCSLSSNSRSEQALYCSP